jgi:hypothetical protein
MLLVAMIATPLLANVAQAQGKAEHANNRFKVCERTNAKNKKDKEVAFNSERREPKKCVPAGPPPVTPPSGGLAEVHGMAFTDANNNGVFDSGDSPLAGVPILLVGSSATTTSGADGTFGFTGVAVGMYTLCAVGGQSQSTPSGGPVCPTGSSGYAIEIPAALPNLWYDQQDFGLR